jgi:hypothetical protein
VKRNRKLIHIVYPVVSLKIVLEEVIHIAEDDFQTKNLPDSDPDLTSSSLVTFGPKFGYI